MKFIHVMAKLNFLSLVFSATLSFRNHSTVICCFEAQEIFLVENSCLIFLWKPEYIFQDYLMNRK